EAAGLVTLADKGYQGSTYAKIPYRGKNKPESQKDANRAHAKLRSPGERANAQLKTWNILRKLRCCPWRAGQLAKAIHVVKIRKQECELCETGTTVAVHQVTGLRELGKPGPGQPAWAALMAQMRRKTLIVCAPCHDWIHANPVAHAA